LLPIESKLRFIDTTKEENLSHNRQSIKLVPGTNSL
jgi:hypothetical protein